jgi:hypothetical protein
MEENVIKIPSLAIRKEIEEVFWKTYGLSVR